VNSSLSEKVHIRVESGIVFKAEGRSMKSRETMDKTPLAKTHSSVSGKMENEKGKYELLSV
jgi:hypothetical protein